jgi:ABC-type nitrate/sulfonate/bicarbonate transport system substrate-binding protein
LPLVLGIHSVAQGVALVFRPRLIARSVLLLLSIILVACGREGGPPANDGVEPVVAVGSQWYGHLPVWAGIEQGIFERHGFEVHWRVIGKSIDRLNAISSGEAQFASLGEIAMLASMAQGNRRFYWVGNQDIAPGFEGLVAQPGITSLADLKGRRIGFPFGSSVDLTCRLLLKANGLDPAKDVKLVNLEVGDVPAVFRAGNVDAALIWEPGFSQLKAVEGATVLAMDTDTEIYRRFGTMTGPDVLILGKDWTDADPERARRFLAAYFEALDWVATHPEGAAELAQGRYIQQDLDLIRNSLAKFVWQGAAAQQRVLSDQGIFPQAEVLIDILHDDMGAIPVEPDFRAWVNRDLLPAAP